MAVDVRRGGDPAGPVLLLLHGLGATGRVWDGVVDLLDEDWHWIVPDLPGHGGSAPLAHYSFGGLAAVVAETVGGDHPVAVLGHSLGGVVGLTLASGWFGARVSAVCALGVKVRWSEQDLAKAAEVAARPSKVFGDRREAIERGLKVAGLADLVSVDAPAAMAGVVASGGGWTLTLDPNAFAVGAPDMTSLLAGARTENVILAAGEHDAMSPLDHLRELRPDATVLEALGHNAHVENPAAMLPLIHRLQTLD
jgi:pimeloyl-ACP methyl ester carboxylesterase